jgi:hypothetical protein
MTPAHAADTGPYVKTAPRRSRRPCGGDATGFRVERFETGIRQKRVRDHHRPPMIAGDGGGRRPFRQAAFGRGRRPWVDINGEPFATNMGRLLAGCWCISLRCDGDHSPRPRDAVAKGNSGGFSGCSKQKEGRLQGDLLLRVTIPARPRLGAGREARPPALISHCAGRRARRLRYFRGLGRRARKSFVAAYRTRNSICMRPWARWAGWARQRWRSAETAVCRPYPAQRCARPRGPDCMEGFLRLFALGP